MACQELEILIRSIVRRIFRIFERPFEAVRADDGVSRRVECISTGRVRRRNQGSTGRGASAAARGDTRFTKIGTPISMAAAALSAVGSG